MRRSICLFTNPCMLAPRSTFHFLGMWLPLRCCVWSLSSIALHTGQSTCPQLRTHIWSEAQSEYADHLLTLAVDIFGLQVGGEGSSFMKQIIVDYKALKATSWQGFFVRSYTGNILRPSYILRNVFKLHQRDKRETSLPADNEKTTPKRGVVSFSMHRNSTDIWFLHLSSPFAALTPPRRLPTGSGSLRLSWSIFVASSTSFWMWTNISKSDKQTFISDSWRAAALASDNLTMSKCTYILTRLASDFPCQSWSVCHLRITLQIVNLS